jgi:hypothetical protein
MGTGSGKKKENQLQKQTETAAAAIKTPSDYELYQKPIDLGFLKDLNSGKDVRQIDGLRWNLNLFNNAGKDPDLQGQGLLGQNQLTGANSNLMGLVGQQMKARQQQQAEGNLYNSTIDAKADTERRLGYFSDAEASRNSRYADASNQMYSTFLHRPKQPSVWQQVLGAGAQVASAFL